MISAFHWCKKTTRTNWINPLKVAAYSLSQLLVCIVSNLQTNIAGLFDFPPSVLFHFNTTGERRQLEALLVWQMCRRRHTNTTPITITHARACANTCIDLPRPPHTLAASLMWQTAHTCWSEQLANGIAACTSPVCLQRRREEATVELSTFSVLNSECVTNIHKTCIHFTWLYCGYLQSKYKVRKTVYSSLLVLVGEIDKIMERWRKRRWRSVWSMWSPCRSNYLKGWLNEQTGQWSKEWLAEGMNESIGEWMVE